MVTGTTQDKEHKCFWFNSFNYCQELRLPNCFCLTFCFFEGTGGQGKNRFPNI
jgi:hypothetical protein